MYNMIYIYKIQYCKRTRPQASARLARNIISKLELGAEDLECVAHIVLWEKPSLFWVFLMFVPSLSWQNDAFYIKTAQKWRFLPPAHQTHPCQTFWTVRSSRASSPAHENAYFSHLSLCLSRACLGKTILFRIKWRKRWICHLLARLPLKRLPHLGVPGRDTRIPWNKIVSCIYSFLKERGESMTSSGRSNHLPRHALATKA